VGPGRKERGFTDEGKRSRRETMTPLLFLYFPTGIWEGEKKGRLGNQRI